MVGIIVAGDTVTARWEHFEHRADIGIRGIAATKEEAFEQTAVALTAVITEPALVEPEEKIEISCRASDEEMLLIDWLSKLLYEMDTRKMLFSRFEVRIEQDVLTAAAWGEKTDVSKHRPAVEVKAATYTSLSVRQQQDQTWLAQCVVDV